MKVCAIQPPYGFDSKQAEKTVQFIIDELNSCEGDIDLILTPEYSNTPGTIPPEEAISFANKWRKQLEDAAIAAAKRCNAIVALSYSAQSIDNKERNTTRMFLPSGEVAGEYWKQQLVLSEPSDHKVDNSYALINRTPTIVEVNNLRFAFVICYDAYFLEYIETLSRCNVDFILVSAMQRAETFENLRLLNKLLAFRTNAFVVRASYSMGENSTVGGTSLVVNPAGNILADMENKTGKLIYDIENPKWKYMRSNSFGGSMIKNDSFIDQGRTPWAYRPAGPFVCLDDKRMKYPRICAHRGFHTVLPENTLPAFGAAIALGADEIEFDIWETKDGVPVTIHDASLDRVSNGSGIVREKTYAQLLELDFGSKCDPSLKGLKIVTLEEILQKFARHTIMNIHIKSDGNENFSRPFIRKIANMLHDYDCSNYAYFMGSSDVQAAAIEVAPEISRCMGAESDMAEYTILKRAIYWKCQKLQFFKPYFNKEMIDQAHQNGIICNLFWSDDPQEARNVLEMGIDTILTNNYLQIAQVRDQFVKDMKK
jgi:glycerophosphoryl diester phosphodiesterase/predicted amidohydrolase